jgi:hypothetical protein
VENEKFHHPLPNGLVKLGLIFHMSNADIYRLGYIADCVNFSLILTFPHILHGNND